MAADAQLRKLLREFLGLAKCQAAGHQCGGSYDAVLMRLNDGPIYARCESEIVRINDEAPHSASLAEGITWFVAAVFRTYLQPIHSPLGASEC